MPLHSIIIPVSLINFALALAPLLVTIFGTFMQVQDYIQNGLYMRSQVQAQKCCDTFDFIVVGAGSAGAAVAARLSENPNYRVLLVEAGGDPNIFSYIPAATSALLNNPSTDWNYKLEKQNGSAFGIADQEIVFPSGKSLGGSSNLNFMVYNRGNPNDYDRWALHTGDLRWSYKKISQYFEKVEDYFGAWDWEDLHGKGGPLRIEKTSYAPGLKYVLNAARELGYKVRDHNIEQKEGFSPIDYTQRRGFRFSTYRAYLLPALKRKNLFIYKYTLATKIIINKHLRAVGITYFRHGLKGFATATKEVIISAGAINTPQLLMLSSIGPSHHLQEIGVDTLVDLPVGENLQDHVTAPAGPFLLDKPESFMLHRDITVKSILDFLWRGVGPLTTPHALTAIGFTSTSYTVPTWPDIMYSVVSLGLSPTIPGTLDKLFNSGNRVQTHLKPFLDKDSNTVLVTLGLPKSRGYVKLRNRNPFSKPIINPRYFSDSGNEDIRVMVKGIQEIVRLYENTTNFRRLNARLIPKSLEGCEQFEFKSDAYFDCTVRLATHSLYHPTSTCSMGKIGDPDAVVDSQLRVIGVKSLRIADASIMPFIINADTNVPTIVIGEMASDMIKNTWSRIK